MIAWLVACGALTPYNEPLDSDTATTGPAPALVINELMPANTSSYVDGTGATPDWIELYNPEATDASLRGFAIGDGESRADAMELDPGLVVPADGFLLLFADELPELGADHLDFSLASEGESVSLWAPDGTGSIVRYGALPEDVAIARAPDGCVGDGCWTMPYGGTPGTTNTPGDTALVTVVAAGSSWRYHDGGAEPSGWTSAAYDDGGWATGGAPLGYGDTHVVTTVSYGADATNKHVTTYFRADFTVAAAPVAATLRLLRDDGAIVYVDGVEIARSAMPDGDATYGTYASIAAGGSDETAWWTFDVDPAVFTPGAHVFAVEVHQAAPDSSDLGFDLALDLAYDAR